MGALGHPLPEETRRLESEYKISGHQRLRRVPQLAYSHSCSWEEVTLAVTPQGGTSGGFVLRPLLDFALFLFLWLVLTISFHCDKTVSLSTALS